MIEFILSGILSSVLGHGIPKGNVQIINKQEVYNVTTTSTTPEDIKADAKAAALAPAPALAPVQIAAVTPIQEVKKKPVMDYVVYKPTNDIEVHLDTQLSHKCDIPKKFVYTVWLKKHTFYGCWEIVNNQTHVLYESGNVEIYNIKELQE
jgi:hypothetical protein